MTEELRAIECYNCGTEYSSAIMTEIGINHYCPDCAKEVNEDNGLCSKCGSELEPIYEDRHPDGIGYLEIVGYKSCLECAFTEE
jgi:hypothetical protein